MDDQKHIVIVGGGFGGVRAALELSAMNVRNVSITLISEKPNFEYTPAFYRYVTGNSAIEVCIPLKEIFQGKNVELIEEKIVSIDKSAQSLSGASGRAFTYDFLILSLGSQTTYFDIPGLKENSFGMKSVNDSLRLRQQITDTLRACKANVANKADQTRDANFVVIGAGATGVEMAGRLIEYARALATEIGVDPSLVTVTLIEGAAKILPLLPANFTDPIDMHLRELGVSMLLNRTVMRQEIEEVYLKNMQMKTKTVIWTSGVMANVFYKEHGFPVDKRGKVEVDEYLRVKGEEAIFVLGDSAITKYSGYAQTAFYDGKYAARVLFALLTDSQLPTYSAKAPVNAIPAGDGWAGVLWGNIRFYGAIGWWFRRIADFRSFLIVLPLGKALKIFLGGNITESCNICSIETNHSHAS